MTGDIFTERIVFSLGWTFINSLWQGGFICIINWIILLMLSKQNARLRYIVSSISLFTILLFTVISFFILSNYYDLYLSNAGVSVNGGAANPAHTGIYNLFFLEFMPLDSTGYLDYFNSNMPLIITIWFWSVLFLSLKQMGGFALTLRLGHYKTSVPSSGWQKKLTDLSKKLGISKPVKLLESAIVKVPTVIGYLKPIVLIPLGLLLSIPESQIETILLHELAHIKRKDFLINILQNILEVIFFFNPFVWLISANIRSEREHCCDDMVVSISGDTISYIKALANISAIDSVKSNYAMALSLNHNHLFKRIDRIIKMKNYKSNNNRVIISVLVLVLGVTFISINAVNGYSGKSILTPQSKPQQEEKKNKQSDEQKLIKDQLIKDMQKKLESANNEEEKKKIEQQIEFIKSDKSAFAPVKTDDSKKKEQMIMELKKKYEATTDEETKKQIEKKIQVLKEEREISVSDKEYAAKEKEQLEKKNISLKAEQEMAAKDRKLSAEERDRIIKELEKKHESTDDVELKKKIETKLKAIAEGSTDVSSDKKADAKKKEQTIAELKKKYEVTTDEETKTKLLKKIKELEAK